MPLTRKVWGVDKKTKVQKGAAVQQVKSCSNNTTRGRVGEGGKDIHRETSSRIWRWQGLEIGVPSPRASPDATENEKKIL